VALLGTVVNDVVSDGEAAKAGSDFVAKPAGFGMTGQKNDAIHDVVDDTIGAIDPRSRATYTQISSRSHSASVERR
jgi:hypothetical protein